VTTLFAFSPNASVLSHLLGPLFSRSPTLYPKTPFLLFVQIVIIIVKDISTWTRLLSWLLLLFVVVAIVMDGIDPFSFVCVFLILHEEPYHTYHKK
jgi:hypothetical protein